MLMRSLDTVFERKQQFLKQILCYVLIFQILQSGHFTPLSYGEVATLTDVKDRTQAENFVFELSAYGQDLRDVYLRQRYKKNILNQDLLKNSKARVDAPSGEPSQEEILEVEKNYQKLGIRFWDVMKLGARRGVVFEKNRREAADKIFSSVEQALSNVRFIGYLIRGVEFITPKSEPFKSWGGILVSSLEKKQIEVIQSQLNRPELKKVPNIAALLRGTVFEKKEPELPKAKPVAEKNAVSSPVSLGPIIFSQELSNRINSGKTEVLGVVDDPFASSEDTPETPPEVLSQQPPKQASPKVEVAEKKGEPSSQGKKASPAENGIDSGRSFLEGAKEVVKKVTAPLVDAARPQVPVANKTEKKDAKKEAAKNNKKLTPIEILEHSLEELSIAHRYGENIFTDEALSELKNRNEQEVRNVVDPLDRVNIVGILLKFMTRLALIQALRGVTLDKQDVQAKYGLKLPRETFSELMSPLSDLKGAAEYNNWKTIVDMSQASPESDFEMNLGRLEADPAKGDLRAGDYVEISLKRNTLNGLIRAASESDLNEENVLGFVVYHALNEIVQQHAQLMQHLDPREINRDEWKLKIPEKIYTRFGNLFGEEYIKEINEEFERGQYEHLTRELVKKAYHHISVEEVKETNDLKEKDRELIAARVKKAEGDHTEFVTDALIREISLVLFPHYRQQNISKEIETLRFHLQTHEHVGIRAFLPIVVDNWKTPLGRYFDAEDRERMKKILPWILAEAKHDSVKHGIQKMQEFARVQNNEQIAQSLEFLFHRRKIEFVTELLKDESNDVIQKWVNDLGDDKVIDSVIRDQRHEFVKGMFPKARYLTKITGAHVKENEIPVDPQVMDRALRRTGFYQNLDLAAEAKEFGILVPRDPGWLERMERRFAPGWMNKHIFGNVAPDELIYHYSDLMTETTEDWKDFIVSQGSWKMARLAFFHVLLRLVDRFPIKRTELRTILDFTDGMINPARLQSLQTLEIEKAYSAAQAGKVSTQRNQSSNENDDEDLDDSDEEDDQAKTASSKTASKPEEGIKIRITSLPQNVNLVRDSLESILSQDEFELVADLRNKEKLDGADEILKNWSDQEGKNTILQLLRIFKNFGFFIASRKEVLSVKDLYPSAERKTAVSAQVREKYIQAYQEKVETEARTLGIEVTDSGNMSLRLHDWMMRVMMEDNADLALAPDRVPTSREVEGILPYFDRALKILHDRMNQNIAKIAEKKTVIGALALMTDSNLVKYLMERSPAVNAFFKRMVDEKLQATEAEQIWETIQAGYVDRNMNLIMLGVVILGIAYLSSRIPGLRFGTAYVKSYYTGITAFSSGFFLGASGVILAEAGVDTYHSGEFLEQADEVDEMFYTSVGGQSLFDRGASQDAHLLADNERGSYWWRRGWNALYFVLMGLPLIVPSAQKMIAWASNARMNSLLRIVGYEKVQNAIRTSEELQVLVERSKQLIKKAQRLEKESHLPAVEEELARVMDELKDLHRQIQSKVDQYAGYVRDNPLNLTEIEESARNQISQLVEGFATPEVRARLAELNKEITDLVTKIEELRSRLSSASAGEVRGLEQEIRAAQREIARRESAMIKLGNHWNAAKQIARIVSAKNRLIKIILSFENWSKRVIFDLRHDFQTLGLNPHVLDTEAIEAAVSLRRLVAERTKSAVDLSIYRQAREAAIRISSVVVDRLVVTSGAPTLRAMYMRGFKASSPSSFYTPRTSGSLKVSTEDLAREAQAINDLRLEDHAKNLSDVERNLLRAAMGPMEVRPPSGMNPEEMVMSIDEFAEAVSGRPGDYRVESIFLKPRDPSQILPTINDLVGVEAVLTKTGQRVSVNMEDVGAKSLDDILRESPSAPFSGEKKGAQNEPGESGE